MSIDTSSTPAGLLPPYQRPGLNHTALKTALYRIKAAKQRLDEAQAFLEHLLVDELAPVVTDARLDMGEP